MTRTPSHRRKSVARRHRLPIVPEFDDYLRPEQARERFAVIPQAVIVGVPRAKHLFVGFAETVLDEIVRRVAPAAYPLPRTYEETA